MSQLTKTLQKVCSAHSGRNCYGVVIVIHELARILCEFHPESNIGQLRDTDHVVRQCPVIQCISQLEYCRCSFDLQCLSKYLSKVFQLQIAM